MTPGAATMSRCVAAFRQVNTDQGSVADVATLRNTCSR
jgi:hypothetical protein